MVESQFDAAMQALDSEHFAIVEDTGAMVYNKADFYATPIPVRKEPRGGFVPKKTCANCEYATPLAPHEWACNTAHADIYTLDCFQPRKSS